MPARQQLHNYRRRTHLAMASLAIASIGVATLATTPQADAARTTGTTGTRRVDLIRPTFSHPTRITNPLFPITANDQVVQLGTEGDVDLRMEITALDETKWVRWNGQRIEAVVSQFVAHADGEIAEVAYDYFAQDDAGNVWYLGEDVTNYDNGVVDNHDGTWLAGRDGTAGMIMPAHPRVGDVYRPENIPGLVFEEVTVLETNVTVDGPTGLVRGAVRVQERFADGTTEDKVFAPGYGEFEAIVPSSDEHVTVAVASDTDAVGGRLPGGLSRLSSAATKLFWETPSRNWTRLESLHAAAQDAWASLTATDIPPILTDAMDRALANLDSAVQAHRAGDVRRAALAVRFATLDIAMQYRDIEDVDEARIDIWRQQVQLDRAADEDAAVASDRVIIAAIEARLDD
jgi:hypothetical protein